MHHYLSYLFWFNVGKYGAIGVLLAGAWLTRQPWFPHRHDGYVSVNGYVHKCSHCGRLPAGAVRTGFYGTDPDSPKAHYYDELRRRDQAGYETGDPSGRPETDDWVTCPSCDREDVAVHTMRDGKCIRCWDHSQSRGDVMTREQAEVFWDQAGPDTRIRIACLALGGVSTVRAVEIIASEGQPMYEILADGIPWEDANERGVFGYAEACTLANMLEDLGCTAEVFQV